MKISVVMPICLLNDTLVQFTRDCLHSIRNQYDELVIIDDNSSVKTGEFKNRATKYIKNDKNLGYIKTVNKGIREATGDYICIVCNDTRIIGGSLRDLCYKGYTFPTILGKEEPFWDGALYCFPRELGGLYDERYNNYFGDLDKFYDALIKKIELKRVGNVLALHHESATTKVLGIRNEAYERDHQYFVDKWGIDPLDRYLTFIKET